jgi:hypothetical protein
LPVRGLRIASALKMRKSKSMLKDSLLVKNRLESMTSMWNPAINSKRLAKPTEKLSSTRSKLEGLITRLTFKTLWRSAQATET